MTDEKQETPKEIALAVQDKKYFTPFLTELKAEIFKAAEKGEFYLEKMSSDPKFMHYSACLSSPAVDKASKEFASIGVVLEIVMVNVRTSGTVPAHSASKFITSWKR